MRIVVVILAVAIVCLGPSTLLAQAPYAISHQGFVTDHGGTPINSNVAITFKMYKGGVQVWSETHPSVQVTGGRYSVELGVITPFDSLTFDVPVELGVTIGGDPETTPRTKLLASPNALNLRNMRIHRRKGSGFGSVTVNVIGGDDANRDSIGVSVATISGGGYSNGPNIVRSGGGTIGGGGNNIVRGDFATIGGGRNHRAYGLRSTIGGGYGNLTGSEMSTVVGGESNIAVGWGSTVAGGNLNSATYYHSSVIGGYQNVASGYSSTILGGDYNAASGAGSLAAGIAARARHSGAFVWNGNGGVVLADSLASTAPNQFLIRASGGVGIGTNTPDGALHITQSKIGTSGVSSEDIYQDDVIIEDGDAILGLYSDQAGTGPQVSS